MSFARFMKMTGPQTVAISGFVFILSGEQMTGLVMLVLGLASLFYFRKEVAEVVKLADNDEVSA